MNRRERFLRACRCQPVDRVPIWLMRQAGRYMASYRDIRKRYSFLTMCQTPEIAAQVTCLPLEQLDVDAAILFSDLLIPFLGMDYSVTYHEKKGPLIESADGKPKSLDTLTIPDCERDFPYLREGIRQVRKSIGENFPLIGFCGAPFTMLSYLIEGGSSSAFHKTLTLMYRQPDLFSAGMKRMTSILVDYGRYQIDSGVDALQIFDTWAGCLSPEDYRSMVLPWTRELIHGLAEKGIPLIYFVRGSAGLLDQMKELDVAVISIDSFQDLGHARGRLGPEIAVQGNLDPLSLLLPEANLVERVRHMLDRHRGQPGWIFNLGHGILPFLDEDMVKTLVQTVQRHGFTNMSLTAE